MEVDTREEARLILAARRGDAAGAYGLFKMHEGIIKKIIYHHMPHGRQNDFEDYMQEAFLGVVDAAGDWDPAGGTGFMGWLYFKVRHRVQLLVASAVVRTPVIFGADIEQMRPATQEALRAARCVRRGGQVAECYIHEHAIVNRGAEAVDARDYWEHVERWVREVAADWVAAGDVPGRRPPASGARMVAVVLGRWRGRSHCKIGRACYITRERVRQIYATFVAHLRVYRRRHGHARQQMVG